jgi:hypothetical protein
MAKGPKSISDRLREWKELLEDVRECRPEWMQSVFGSGAKQGSAVPKAANYFKLDLTKKDDTDLLLRILAQVAFPERGREKGSKQWGVDRLTKLGRHWREVERMCAGISDIEAAKKIQKQHPKDYQSPDVIRLRLPDARLMIGAYVRGNAKKLEEASGKKGPKDLELALKELGEAVDNRNRLSIIWINELLGKSRTRRREALKKIPLINCSFKGVLTTLREIETDLRSKLPVK